MVAALKPAAIRIVATASDQRNTVSACTHCVILTLRVVYPIELKDLNKTFRSEDVFFLPQEGYFTYMYI